MDQDSSLYVLGYGLITFVVMLINYTALPLLFRSLFDPERWNVLKNIMLGVWNILWIAVFNLVYTGWAGDISIQPSMLLPFLIGTIAVGMFPLTILVFVNELYLSDKHKKVAEKMSSQLNSETIKSSNQSNQKLIITGNTQGDVIELHEDELLFISAEDNYCNVYFTQGEKVSSKLLRITLKEIESQLDSVPHILRCHRSYIVNKHKITRISGNARAYYLHLNLCDEHIPLSRGFKRETLIS